MEFKRWLAELLKDGEEAPEMLEGDEVVASTISRDNYQTVSTQEQWQQWLNKLKGAEVVAFDTETTSLNPRMAELVGLSLCIAPGEACYVPLAHQDIEFPEQLDRNQVLADLKPWLENPEAAKVGQNLKYDASVLIKYDIRMKGMAFDTMLESYVLDSVGTRHDMDSLSLKYLGHATIHYEDIAGKGAKQVTFDQIPVAQAAPYAAEDADITLRLHQHLCPKLQKEASLKAVFDEIEMPLMPVLARMEQMGVLIDAELLEKQSSEIAERITELEKEAYDIAGEEFNLGSPKQIQAIFYDKLKLPVLKKTPKGAPSTNEEVLQQLALDYPLPKVILQHRGLAKLKSTYTDKLPTMIDANSGRVHTSYHQAVAATGRLSSSDPNLQNIPIRTEEGRRIRQAFIAPEGYKIMAADYSQIELRIMAHLSGDKGLLDAFAHGEDVHRATAAEVFGVSVDEVTIDQRRSAKAINFGLIYGMSAFGLARQLSIPRNDAQKYIDVYFERYPGVKNYMETTRQQAREPGYVETLFGRRLYLPEINARNGMRRQAAERTAINAPMQGTAADIIKRAMIRTDQWLADQPDVHMVMQVHDELVFEVPQARVDEVEEKITELMQSAAELNVPLLVECGVGDNWDEAH
jgi:DNA polymerase-1